MSATRQDTWSLEDDQVATVSLEDAMAHDAYWAGAHAREDYFRPGLDYEDYAPAYCVGYAGWAQYGGAFEDAQHSLLSNWARIKGGSRLTPDEARLAMHAAWDRAQAVAQAARQPALHVDTHPLPWSELLGRLLQGANAWLDKLLGERPVPGAVHRRPQAGVARQ